MFDLFYFVDFSTQNEFITCNYIATLVQFLVRYELHDSKDNNWLTMNVNKKTKTETMALFYVKCEFQSKKKGT